MMAKRLGVLIFMMLMSDCAVGKSEEAVILLHGLCRTSASMTRMEEFLSRNGYTVLNVNYDSRVQRVAELAETVIPAALAHPRLQGAQRIHFVTHSLGGILVRSHYSRHEPAKLGRVVMLGPPNQGSEVVDRLKNLAIFKLLNGPAGDELGTDPRSVPNTLGPVNFELGVIAGNRTINWINSLWIAGPDDGKVSVEKTKVEGMKAHRVMRTSHPFMMKSPAVLQATLVFLASGKFPD